jgi:very-short-patch-repair endonuclease
MSAAVFHNLPLDGSGELGSTAVAAAQHGLVTRGQLLSLGFSAKAIEHRVRVGRLHRVHRGVFAVGHPSLPPPAHQAAALLYAGDDTLLSHESAAAVWGLTSTLSFVAITVIGRHVRSQPELRVHQVKALDIRDVRIHRGFPVTAPARTLIDCATSPTIDRMLNEARVLKLVKNADIQAALDRCPGRKGVAAMRALLKAEDDTGFTRSEAERILRRLIAAAKLEVPIFNTYVMGLEVDAYWPQNRVVVEVDGFAAHGHQAAFERDRGRDNKLIAAGYIVLRFTWRQLTHEPMVVLATIVKVLTVRIHTNLVLPKTVGSPLT